MLAGGIRALAEEAVHLYFAAVLPKCRGSVHCFAARDIVRFLLGARKGRMRGTSASRLFPAVISILKELERRGEIELFYSGRAKRHASKWIVRRSSPLWRRYAEISPEEYELLRRRREEIATRLRRLLDIVS